MRTTLGTPDVDGLSEIVSALRDWQLQGAPLQLHPGDVGWIWRFGTQETASAIRSWSRDGQLLAIGMLDGPTVLRLAIAPHARQEEELARQVVADVVAPARGVLPSGKVNVEVLRDSRVHQLLVDEGWPADEPWAPLRRDLSQPVAGPGLRIEAIGREQVHERVAVHCASFDSSTFTDDKWEAMAGGVPYADGRCLVAYDDRDVAVAAVTVWSAGPGRPGLLEPMGVHRDHRGHGYGRAITLAAAAALRDLGSSSAVVCTPSSNVGGVATYRSAGFEPLSEVRDRYRAE